MNKLHKHAQVMGLVDAPVVVSQEGLIGDLTNWVRDLFKYKPTDHNKLIGKALTAGQAEVDSYRKLRKLLQKCFADDRWLSHQEFNVGEVNSTFAASALRFGGQPLGNPLASILTNTDRLVTQMSSVAVAAATHSSFLYGKYTDLLHESRSTLSVVRAAYEERQRKQAAGENPKSFTNTLLGDIIPSMMLRPKVERAIREIQVSGSRLSPQYYWSTVSPRFELFQSCVETGGFGARTLRSLKDPKHSTALPALNARQAKELALLILSWMDKGLLGSPEYVLKTLTAQRLPRGGVENIDTYVLDLENEHGTDPSDEELFWFVLDRFAEGRELEGMLDADHFASDWVNNSAVFTSLETAAVGIIHWIGASIKGRLATPSV